jgi:hypothetical protein
VFAEEGGKNCQCQYCGLKECCIAVNRKSAVVFRTKYTVQQVGNLSTHALQFARFKRKRLGASKYSNLIFKRFIGVFSLVFCANQNIVNLLHCWEGEEGMRTFRG